MKTSKSAGSDKSDDEYGPGPSPLAPVAPPSGEKNDLDNGTVLDARHVVSTNDTTQNDIPHPDNPTPVPEEAPVFDGEVLDRRRFPQPFSHMTTFEILLSVRRKLQRRPAFRPPDDVDEEELGELGPRRFVEENLYQVRGDGRINLRELIGPFAPGHPQLQEGTPSLPQQPGLETPPLHQQPETAPPRHSKPETTLRSQPEAQHRHEQPEEEEAPPLLPQPERPEEGPLTRISDFFCRNKWTIIPLSLAAAFLAVRYSRR